MSDIEISEHTSNSDILLSGACFLAPLVVEISMLTVDLQPRSPGLGDILLLGSYLCLNILIVSSSQYRSSGLGAFLKTPYYIVLAVRGTLQSLTMEFASCQRSCVW